MERSTVKAPLREGVVVVVAGGVFKEMQNLAPE